MFFVYIIQIGPKKLRVVHPILLRGVLKAAGAGGSLFQAGSTVRLGDGLGPPNQLPGLHGLQLHAEDGQELGVQGPAEAEALGRVAHGGQLQGAQVLLDPGSGQGAEQPVHDEGVVRRTVDVDEGAVPEGPQSVGGGVGSGEGVQPQAASVDDGLPQGPEDQRTVEAPQDLRHIRRIGKGQVLEDDQVRLQGLQIGPQGVHRKKLVLRADKVRVKALQQFTGTGKGLIRAGHMEGADAHGDIDGSKGFHRWVSFSNYMTERSANVTALTRKQCRRCPPGFGRPRSG